MSDTILKVEHLNVFYKDNSKKLAKNKLKQVLFDVSFEVKAGEIYGIVGESGCGKSTLSKAILGINKLYDGEIVHFSKKPQMIFQDPYSSLNPSWTVGKILEEPLRLNGVKDKTVRKEKVEKMLTEVGLSAEYVSRYPSELSGGQRQRVSIATALIGEPKLVVCDEPLSAIDVTVQAQIMELMLTLQKKHNLTYLFISHDIDVVYQMCDRIMVMKDGKVVEIGETEAIFAAPKEDYTKTLINF